MPLPKGEKDYSHNPFNVHCIHENSLLSAATVGNMEAAWDKALEIAINTAKQHRAKKTVEALTKLLSWRQREG